jgi:hypothetical protein
VVIWAVALLLSDGGATAMTLTVAAGSEEEVTEKAVALASESHPGMRVAETIARGVLDDRG